jgi:hypothetical protein
VEDPEKKLKDQGEFKNTFGGKFVLRGVNPNQKIKARTRKKFNPIHTSIPPI